MLYVADKIVEIGGIVIPGHVKKVEVTETATVDEVKDDNGKLKAVQAIGYEAGKVNITVTLEDMAGKDTLSQLMDIQRLFKASGAQTPNLMPIVCEDCAARGIGAVFIKSVTSAKVTEKSIREIVLECVAPEVVGIQVEVVPGETAAAVQAAGASAVAGAAVAAAAVPKKNQTNAKSKTTKAVTKSPANDSQPTYTHRINAQSLAAAKAKRDAGKG